MDLVNESLFKFDSIPEPLSYQYLTSFSDHDPKKTFEHSFTTTKTNKKYQYKTQNPIESNYLKLLLRVYLTSESKSNYEAQIDERQLLLTHSEEGIVQKFIFLTTLSDKERLILVEDENKNLKETVENLKTANETLLAEIATLKSSMLQVLVENADLTARIGNIEEKNFENRAQNDQNTNEIKSCSKTLDKISVKMDEMVAGSQVTSKNLAQNGFKVDKIIGNLDQIIAKVNMLEEKIEILENEKPLYLKPDENGDIDIDGKLRFKEYSIGERDKQLEITFFTSSGGWMKKDLITGDLSCSDQRKT